MKSAVKRLVIGSPFEHQARKVWATVRSRRPQTLTATEAKNALYDEQTVEIARRVLSGSGLCVDAGAHTGVMLGQFISVSPTSTFVAIEPIPGLANHLRKEFPQAEVQQTALADFTGETEFRHVLDSAQESSIFVRPEREEGRGVRTFTVPVRQLDEIIGDRPVEFLKLDVEGAELAALRGATHLLTSQQPAIVVECGPAQIDEVAALLTSHDYRLYLPAEWLRGGGPVDVAAAKRDGEFYYLAIA